jgi:tetratricopeptide (TPR) repeat protein
MERSLSPAPPPGASPAGAPPAASAAAPTPIARLLTETDVYLKYGLHQKALDHVQKILAEDAENPDALERIRDIRDAMGDRPGAAEAAERAVQSLLARGGEGRIEHAIDRLRVLDPAHAEMVVEEMPLPDDEPAPPAESVEVLPPENSGVSEPEPDLQPGSEGVAEPAAAFEPIDLIAAESELEPVAALVPPEDQGPPPVVDDERLEPPADAATFELEIGPAEPAEPGGEEVEELEVSDVEELEAAELVPEPPSAAPTPAVPPPLPDRAPPRLEAEMEEVEFYEQQGLFEEALLAVRELAAAHPGHPAVEQARARIEGRAELEAGGSPPDVAAPGTPLDPQASPGPESYASTGTTGIFDLGAELSAELGPELAPTPTGEFQYSVADVFDQFKRGLEKTVRPDDSATKYDLGIAFQEMGMLDEALEQFRSALAGGDGRREVEILNMIGVCLGMKGAHREAVEAYRQALRSEFLSGDGAKAIHFELGGAHEALGEAEVALWYFQKIAQEDPAYRGAGDRVERLGGGPGSPPADGGLPAPGSDGNPSAAAAELTRLSSRKNVGSG